MKLPKVSLISPCYNGASYVRWFLDSLLLQTYSNVEFIFVNDGSTDNTEEIFMSYKPKLEEKGWQVIYIKQENKGQAAALNAGLKIFTGEYLSFPDSDDILYPEHIAKKVDFMEKNSEYALAFCALDEVKESNLNKVIGIQTRTCSDNLFDDLIHRNNILWTPIGNIFRSNKFLEAIPLRTIYEGKGGQNFQMLLPMAHKFKDGYIKEALGKYVIRKSSHSRLKKTRTERNAELFDIWINTILSLDDTNTNKAKYINESYNHLSIPPQYIDFTWKISLFKFIPLIKIKKKSNKIKIYFLGIHLFTIKDIIYE